MLKKLQLATELYLCKKVVNLSKNILFLSVCLLFAMLLQKCVAVKANYFKKDLGNNADVSQHLTVTEVEDTGMVKCAGICALDKFCFGFALYQPSRRCSTLQCARSDDIQKELPNVLYAETDIDFVNPTLLARGNYKINFGNG